MTEKKKSKKTKEPKIVKGRKVDIEVELALSDKAKLERGHSAAQKLEARDKLIQERKTVGNEYASKIKALDCEAKVLLMEFTTGIEETTVTATEVKDFGKGLILYKYKGKVVKTREMNLADRQGDLPLGDPRPAPGAPAIVKLGEAPKEDKACVATPGKKAPRGEKQPLEKRDPDIASVMRAETSRKTKHNAADGARA